VNDNPWEATTLEWTAPAAAARKLVTTPIAYRGYEYSLPDAIATSCKNEPKNGASERVRRKTAEPARVDGRDGDSAQFHAA
jgi:hypothetical protein